MKKTFGFLFIAMATLLFPLQVFAVDFSINQSDIHAYLKENGSVQVRETHTYEFDGKFNGIIFNPMTDYHHEDHLIHFLFDKVGKNGVFTFEKLDEYVNKGKNQQSLQNQIRHWLTLVKEEIHSHGLTEKKLKLRWLTGIVGCTINDVGGKNSPTSFLCL